MGMDHPRLDLRLHWLDLLTLGFGFYAANFGNYGKTYGSLATVVVLVTWMYLSAYALIFGAELNSELEHQTARDTTAGAKSPWGNAAPGPPIMSPGMKSPDSHALKR